MADSQQSVPGEETMQYAFCSITKTHPSFIVPHYKHKAAPTAPEGRTLLIQGGKTGTVLVQAVDQLPILLDAQPLGDHDANLLCDGGGH